MKKNSNQIDLFSADNKSNQSKNILTAIDIGSDKIVCFIAKIDETIRAYSNKIKNKSVSTDYFKFLMNNF